VLILVQDRCDARVRFDASQLANHPYNIAAGRVAMLPAVDFGKLHLGMIPALPVQRKPYRLSLAGGRDLFQRDTKQALLVFRRTVRIVP
jgi:hypothetical protein